MRSRFSSIVATLIVMGACLIAGAQTTSPTASVMSQATGPADIGGQLIASNFAHWTASPTAEGTRWMSPGQCYGTSGGIVFPMFATNAPIKVVDVGIPANTETVTPSSVFYSVSGCNVSLPFTHPHTNYYLESGTFGLQEAANWAGSGNYVIFLTSDWATLGGTTSMVKAAVLGTNTTIDDMRTADETQFTGKFTITSGCTTSVTTGGRLAGSFTASSSTCSPVITPGMTAYNGFACTITDLTTGSATIRETAYSTTAVTFTGASLGGTDQFVFNCVQF